jgi:hypothetical protein
MKREEKNVPDDESDTFYCKGGIVLFLLPEEGGEEPEDNNGTDDCNKELTETAVACGADAEELEDPAADGRTYDTEDEVEDAAIAARTFDAAGNVASGDA